MAGASDGGLARMTLSVLPNLLTLARMVAVLPLVWLLLVEAYGWALVIAVFAGISDFLDGWLARRFGWQSEFGNLADPLADKLLVAAVLVTFAVLGELPWWLVVVVLLRDAIIVLGGLAYHLIIDRVVSAPTWLSRFNMFCQVCLMWLLLVRLALFPLLPRDAEVVLVWLIVALSAITLGQYIWNWGRRAYAIGRRRELSG